MTHIKCIYFDCMETLIDVKENPDMRLYSWWAYNGCGCEDLWENFDAFSREFIEARDQLTKSLRPNEEYALLRRMEYMLQRKKVDDITVRKAVEALSANYWKNYKANCFVDDKVRETLSLLSSRFKCGVVSNFMVPEGIEDLLRSFEIDHYFDFVVTSIHVGWRKPHPFIYDAALELTREQKEHILFVGDNYTCDYEGPVQYGLNAVLLDKENKYAHVNRRISHLKELTEIIESFTRLTM